MDYKNPISTLFWNLGELNDVIAKLKLKGGSNLHWKVDPEAKGRGSSGHQKCVSHGGRHGVATIVNFWVVKHPHSLPSKIPFQSLASCYCPRNLCPK